MFDNDTIKMININNHNYIQFKKLNELGINHAISMIDLNFSFKNQSKENLNKNIDIICNDFNFNKNNLSRPEQNHSNNTEILEKVGINIYKDTDGLITNKKNTPLAITTADCIPIIIYDQNKKIISNIHSGWKGTLNTILLNTINILKNEYHSNLDDLLFFFGPSICKNCFEVDSDVRNLFYDKFNYLNNIDNIITYKKPKYYIDTVLLNITLLKNIGIKKENIYLSNICTFHNSNYFHSYRKEKENYGLGITIITL